MTLTDVQHAARALARTPKFLAGAAGTLALGIGAVTAIYMLADAIVVRPLPFPHAARVVAIENTYDFQPATAPKLALDAGDWQAMRGTFAAVAIYEPGGLNLSTRTRSIRIDAADVTPDFFRVLGVSPAVGRTFAEDESVAPYGDVALLSAGLSRRLFGTQASALGRTVTLHGRAFTVVGVMPRSFTFPGRTDVWIPRVYPADALQYAMRRTVSEAPVIALLRPGVRRERAAGDAARAERAFDRTHEPWSGREPVHLVALASRLRGDAAQRLRALSTVAALILALACLNVAALLLARAELREHEMALRAALGASRRGLVMAAVMEGMGLAVLGCADGVLLAALLRPLLTHLLPAALVGATALAINGRVVAIAVAASAVSALAFSVAPAVRLLRTDPQAVLVQRGSRYTAGAGRTFHAFLTVQIGLTVAITIAAGLLFRSVWELRHVELGFEPNRVVTANVTLPPTLYHTTGEYGHYYREGVQRLRSIPGVTAAGVVNVLPLTEGSAAFTFDPEGTHYEPSDPNRPRGEYLVVSPGYFRAMGITLLRGRLFTDAEAQGGARVVVVDEQLARQLWRGGSVLGERIRMPRDSMYTIVGVVHPVRDRAVDGSVSSPGQLYFPAGTKAAAFSVTFVARTSRADPAIMQEVRAALASIDPAVPPFEIRSMDDVVGASIVNYTVVGRLVLIAAVIALLLAMAGMVGVLMQAVSRREREIGVRLALGANAWRVRRMVLGQVLLVCGLGTAAGVTMAGGVGQLLSHLLYGVAATDPFVWLIAVVSVNGAALLASTVALRRATSVDPVSSLRSE